MSFFKGLASYKIYVIDLYTFILTIGTRTEHWMHWGYVAHPFAKTFIEVKYWNQVYLDNVYAERRDVEHVPAI